MALDAFREETRRWLIASAPAAVYAPPRTADDLCWGGRKTRYPDDVKRWLDVMAERGWTAPMWPREYGGGGLAPAEARVLTEEMAKLRLRPPLTGFGLSMIGPLLLHEGSEELKRVHLPPIVRGEIRWCQGYSEPGAGSDLASLQTRAVRDVDDYIRNGRVADPIVRDRITQVEMDQACLDLTLARARDGAKAGHRPGPESSIFKLYGTELNQRRRALMVEILGPQALGWEGPGFADEELKVTRDWLRSRGNSIEGGTSEVQLNIIAKRVLGLPD